MVILAGKEENTLQRLVLKILWLLLVCTGFSVASLIEDIDGETLNYKLYHRGIHAANSTLSFSVKNDSLAVISWSLETTKTASIFFRINNVYQTTVNLNTWLPDSLNKQIEQSNTPPSFTTIYDRINNKATTSNGFEWSIHTHCVDMLTMLYATRYFMDKDSLSFNLDVESQLWKTVGHFTNSTENEISSRSIEYAFFPLEKIKDREWQADLFTNRIASKNSTFTIILTRKKPHVPILIKFGAKGKTVKMELVKD